MPPRTASSLSKSSDLLIVSVSTYDAGVDVDRAAHGHRVDGLLRSCRTGRSRSPSRCPACRRVDRRHRRRRCKSTSHRQRTPIRPAAGPAGCRPVPATTPRRCRAAVVVDKERLAVDQDHVAVGNPSEDAADRRRAKSLSMSVSVSPCVAMIVLPAVLSVAPPSVTVPLTTS